MSAVLFRQRNELGLVGSALAHDVVSSVAAPVVYDNQPRLGACLFHNRVPRLNQFPDVVLLVVGRHHDVHSVHKSCLYKVGNAPAKVQKNKRKQQMSQNIFPRPLQKEAFASRQDSSSARKAARKELVCELSGRNCKQPLISIATCTRKSDFRRGLRQAKRCVIRVKTLPLPYR